MVSTPLGMSLVNTSFPMSLDDAGSDRNGHRCRRIPLGFLPPRFILAAANIGLLTSFSSLLISDQFGPQAKSAGRARPIAMRVWGVKMSSHTMPMFKVLALDTESIGTCKDRAAAQHGHHTPHRAHLVKTDCTIDRCRGGERKLISYLSEASWLSYVY